MSSPLVGLIGPPNVGKSTLFSALTLLKVKIAPYPFTTIEPNTGVAYLRVKCVCREFKVKDNPRNSLCIEGNRFIPVKIIDVAGLVPDAWKGRGLGNRFLDHVRRADVLVMVIDASGSTDSEGRPVSPGTHDPIEDVRFLEKEITMWIVQMLKREWNQIVKLVEVTRKDIREVLYNKLSGLGIDQEDIQVTLNESGLINKRVGSWSEDDIYNFVNILREKSKPMVIAANKADLPTAKDNIKALIHEYGDKYKIIPTCAEAELALRRAAQMGLVKYLPGDNSFEVVQPSKLTESQKKALEYIEERVFKQWKGTGVQDVINTALLEVLGMVVVFPVEDENRLCDHKGNILPDALLMAKGSTARDLAFKIHSELGKRFICAIDVRTRRRLGAEYKLKHLDVIKIVSSRT